MKKYYLSFLLSVAISAVSFGQTTKPKLDEVKNDPKTTANASKADAQVVDKKIVTDKTTLKTAFSDKRKMKARKRKSRRTT